MFSLLRNTRLSMAKRSVSWKKDETKREFAAERKPMCVVKGDGR